MATDTAAVLPFLAPTTVEGTAEAVPLDAATPRHRCVSMGAGAGGLCKAEWSICLQSRLIAASQLAGVTRCAGFPLAR